VERSARFENSLNYESSPDRNLPAPLPIWRIGWRAHKFRWSIPPRKTGYCNAFLDGWNDFRRGQDYYEEGSLIWLRADTIIREQTHGQKSPDDFLRVFLGQPDTEPIVVPYTGEDVEAALSAICPCKLARVF